MRTVPSGPLVTIVFPSGEYEDYEPEFADRLRLWVAEGGTAIGMRSAVPWLRATTLDWVDPESEEALEAARAEVERSLNEATAQAYKLAGADVARIAPGAATDPDAPPAKPGLLLKTYLTVMSLLRPFARAVLKVRERQGKEDPRRRPERLSPALTL